MFSNTSHYIFSGCDRVLLAMQSSRFDGVCSSFDRCTVPTAKHSLTNLKTNPSWGQQSCCLLALLFSSNVLVDAAAAAADTDVGLLPLVLFCTLVGQHSDLICFNPTYFWKSVYSLFEVHTSNPSSQVLITPPDVWWMLPLGATLSLSLFPPFVFLLFESELLLFCRHKAMPHSLVFTHVSPSKSSPLQLHFPFFFSLSFMHLLYSFLYSCSVSVLVFVLPRKLSLPFHAYVHKYTHTHTNYKVYISPVVLRVKSLNVLASQGT